MSSRCLFGPEPAEEASDVDVQELRASAGGGCGPPGSGSRNSKRRNRLKKGCRCFFGSKPAEEGIIRCGPSPGKAAARQAPGAGVSRNRQGKTPLRRLGGHTFGVSRRRGQGYSLAPGRTPLFFLRCFLFRGCSLRGVLAGLRRARLRPAGSKKPDSSDSGCRGCPAGENCADKFAAVPRLYYICRPINR